MIGPDFIDEADCGNFFDHIDDLLDFPCEDIDVGLTDADFNSFPSIWTTQSESLPCSDSVYSGNSNSDLSAELSVPYEEIVQMEWLSNFVDDSFSEGSLTINKSNESSSINTDTSPRNQFQTSSGVSVLESSSSSSVGQTLGGAPGKCGRGRPRTKRPRPPTFNPRSVIQLISPATQFMAPKMVSETENARLVIKLPKQVVVSEEKPNKKIKFSVPKEQQAIRKCMHCEISKTPQWRAGPMGPKTLCNACGVRYKSGRLFPEYRPAASPTFVPSLHSNSHKKVVEMRSKIDEDMSANLPELIPNDSNLALNYI